MSKKKCTAFLISTLSTASVMLFIFIAACSPQTIMNQKPTEFQVLMHDEPFKLSDKTVEELNITVERMEIIRSSDGEHITLLDTPVSMDVLQIHANNPVVLSTVSVEPGTYEQLRLILSNDSTIVVDGEEYPIKIPSGVQTGVKLDGPFTVPQGKLFKLVLDFIAKESVLYTKGQGYKLKPVIIISETQDVLGTFNGKLEMGLGESETVINLYSNNTFKAKMSNYREYTITGDYYYNSVTKILKLDDLKIKRSGMPAWQLKEIAKRLPDDIRFNVIQWTPDSVLIFDVAGSPRTLQRTDTFDFSSAVTYTDMTLTIHYPDNSRSGQKVVAQLQSIDDGTPTMQDIGEFNGSSAVISFSIPNNYFITNSINYAVSAFLLDAIEDYNIDVTVNANQPGIVMSGTYFSETTNNPWQPVKITTVTQGAENADHVTFPKPLLITMTPNDFTSNNPLISWDSYPGAENGYLVLVLLKDRLEEKDITYDNDGNNVWDVVYTEVTTKTEARIFSDTFVLVPAYISDGADVNEGMIQEGELIRIEVYVLDGSGRLNTTAKTGALFMDSLNIIR